MIVALLHIPKSAGTTLESLARFHYGDAFRGLANVLTDPEAAERRIDAVARKPKIRAVSGHVTAGLLDRLPGAQLVTILREPVDRALSHQAWIERRGAGSLGSTVPDNLQTRMLCGLVRPLDALPADALDRAKERLDAFAYVGVTDRFDELLAALNRGLGWPTTAYRRARENAERPVPDEEARRLAAAANELDAELYLHAQGLVRDADPEEVSVIRESSRRWSGGAPEDTAHEERVEAALEQARLMQAAHDRREQAKRG